MRYTMVMVEPHTAWQLLSIRNVSWRNIYPHRVIEDLPSISACDTIEKAAWQSLLARQGVRFSDIDFDQTSIGKEPITEYVRPKGFNGSLLGGKALILPLDAEVAAADKPALLKRLKSGSFSNESPGLRLLFSGELRSSRPGRLGTVAVDASYFYRRVFKDGKPVGGPDYVQRTVSVGSEHQELIAAVQAQIIAASRQAHEVMAGRVKYAFGAGSPGLGKRG